MLSGYEFSSFSCNRQTSFKQVGVDLRTNLHAVLELVLVVALGSFRFDILLDGVDLRLVLNQFLLDVIQPIVYVTLQNFVLFRVVLHRMETNLFG